MPLSDSDVAIVGSGPNALSLAAHLKVHGVSFRIFGPVMKFWHDMPASINLKSFAHATNVCVPAKGTTFVEYCRARGLEDFEPCSMASFAAYGTWVRDRFVPELEETIVASVTRDGDEAFRLRLASGETLRARRIVCATGLSNLEFVPPALRGLPPGLLTHTTHISDYSPMRGLKVAVVGAGASAVEAAALVREAGGHPELIVREGEVVFHDRLAEERSLYVRLRYPMSVLGPGMKSRLMEEFPWGFHLLPEDVRVRVARNHLGPAAPWWISERVKGLVSTRLRTVIARAEAHGSGVRLTVRREDTSEETLDVDRVVAGTGFVADLDALTYLDPDLRARMRRVERAPVLSRHFESSIKGAYFVGPIATLSFGPLFRFVAGAKYAAPSLARHLAGTPSIATHVLDRLAARRDLDAARSAQP